MTYSAKIRLHWLVSGPPNGSSRGPRFSLPARFDHQGEDWTNDAWSLVVNVDGAPDSQGYQIGTAKFLAPNAPQDWLSSGKQFTLFEGRLPVAKGEVK
jgi:hypothetical protein